ncbi:hypothetical protein DM01DRAFT_308268 [Hesseltinella vesiculosa]|uniref:Cyanovirin-N domain-containing protein n=1 Tax=Hesseltinella vesiculosa TaxID=101127 RepID=A0A1X2GDH7_9FUNG|nr:hypothetical protein DM01DRAFT_308268 [Hesseltinella vesiculosa]
MHSQVLISLFAILLLCLSRVQARDCSESEVRYCSYGLHHVVMFPTDKMCEVTDTDHGGQIRCDYIGMDWHRDHHHMKRKCKDFCDITDSHHHFNHNRNFVKCECYHY